MATRIEVNVQTGERTVLSDLVIRLGKPVGSLTSIEVEQERDSISVAYRISVFVLLLDVMMSGAAAPSLISRELNGHEFVATSQQQITKAVLLRPFSATSWTLDISFMINDFGVKQNLPDNGEPAFITFSDDINAGFVIIWPTKIEYYDAGPVVTKIREWSFANIANKRTRMVVSKIPNSVTIQIEGTQQTIPMGGATLAPGNEESGTRNFIRFGTVWYDNLTTDPQMTVYSMRVSQ